MIIKTLDEYLQTKPREERAIHCFHPSSLHKSAKELYNQYLNGDNNQRYNPRILRIFDNGHDVHRRVQGYLYDIGILKQEEVPVENEEYEIKGHTDGIIEISGRKGVLEIKSMNTKNFYSSYEPKPEHLIQINVYMFCLNISRGCLLYECKDNQELKEFFIKEDSVILDSVLKKIKLVQDCINKGEEP